jgi:hypothetical protein
LRDLNVQRTLSPIAAFHPSPLSGPIVFKVRIEKAAQGLRIGEKNRTVDALTSILLYHGENRWSGKSALIIGIKLIDRGDTADWDRKIDARRATRKERKLSEEG